MPSRATKAYSTKKGASEIAQAARKEGMMTLKERGIKKALQGITSLEEVMRVVFVKEE